MIRRAVRDLFLAVYLALAPSEHESFWGLLESRPAAVLPVGEPVVALVRWR